VHFRVSPGSKKPKYLRPKYSRPNVYRKEMETKKARKKALVTQKHPTICFQGESRK
jgi:hypothetical protein